MTTEKHPETWLLLAILILLALMIVMIAKHPAADANYQQKIDDHSEIVDTI